MEDLGNLENTIVMLKGDDYSGGKFERLFRCEMGPGCDPLALEEMIYGHFVDNQQKAQIERSDVLKVVERLE